MHIRLLALVVLSYCGSVCVLVVQWNTCRTLGFVDATILKVSVGL